jgi:hypothetical protein
MMTDPLKAALDRIDRFEISGISIQAEIDQHVADIDRKLGLAHFDKIAADLDRSIQVGAGVQAHMTKVVDGILGTGQIVDARLGAVMNEIEAHYIRKDAPAVPELDAPLTLDQALFLPDLYGTMLRSEGLSIPSPTVKRKTLENAIKAGELAHGWFNTKNMFVTRRGIQEWLKRVEKVGEKRKASKKVEMTVGEIRASQKGTRSKFAAENAMKASTAMTDAKAKMQAALKNLKKK